MTESTSGTLETVPGAIAGTAPLQSLAVASILLLLLLWVSWRKPTLVLMIALASLALRPQLLWGGPAIGYELGLHHTLIVLGLAANALRHGIRLQGGWPIPALLATFVLGLAFGDLHPKLTLPFMLMSLGILVLPFTFTQVVLAPGSRRAYALVIMMAPLLSVALGGLLQLSGIHTMVWLDAPDWYVFRLEGATGNAAVFAVLAFAGFAVALHEATRPGRPWAGPFAVLNLALVILSGTRMGIFASVVFLITYVALSEDLRTLLRQHRVWAIAAAGVVAMALLFYWPTLVERMFAEDAKIQLSQRDELWSFYSRELLMSPIFGRGFGAGFVAGENWIDGALITPHNEYLHILVIGGVVGFILLAAAIVAWIHRLVRVVSANDRVFLLATCIALGFYCMTDNLLVYSSALALYASLTVLLVRPGVVPPEDYARTADLSWFRLTPACEEDPR